MVRISSLESVEINLKKCIVLVQTTILSGTHLYDSNLFFLTPGVFLFMEEEGLIVGKDPFNNAGSFPILSNSLFSSSIEKTDFSCGCSIIKSMLFIVSKLEMKEGKGEYEFNNLSIDVEKADGETCDRCWQVVDETKEGLCPRCETVLK